jgi:hypothetical protein
VMDNSQSSSSEPVVNSEEKVASSEVFNKTVEKESSEVKSEKKDKQVPLHELYKERNRRRAVEEEVRELRGKIDELDSKYSKVRQTQDDDELVLEAEKELGIDKEAARKLLNIQRKVAERSNPKQSSQSNTVGDPVLRAMDDFKKRATEASSDHEDWNEMIPGMQAIMAKEIEQNGMGAYNKSPEYYYSKALKAQSQSEGRVKKEIEVEKGNNVTASQTETSSSSGGTRTQGSKITQAIFDANRSDVKWVQDNVDEIKSLWRQGKLK